MKSKSISIVMILMMIAYSSYGQTISSFTLVDADSNSDILSLQDGDTINLASLVTSNLNVRADLDSGSTGSVVFLLNGVKSRTENVAPYALLGDQNGNYYPWNPVSDDYEIEALAFSSSGGNGDTLSTLVVSFSIIDQAVVVIPEAPSNLSFSQTVRGTVDLSWVDNSANETGFEIQYADFLQTNTNWQLLTTVTADLESFTDDLGTEEYRYYRVRSFNSAGYSAFSNEIEIANLPVPPTNFAASDVTSSGVKLSWDSAPYGNDYLIEFKTDSDSAFAFFDALYFGYEEFDYSGLEASTSYSFRIRTNFQGNSSQWSNLLQITTPEITVTNVDFVNCPSDTLTIGDQINLVVDILPIDAANQTIAFTASDGLSVGYLSGEFTANNAGVTTVTATSFSDGSVFDQCLINVKEQVLIDPYQEVEGESYSSQSGTQLGGSGIAVGYIQNDDYISFDDVDFDRGPFSGQVTASSRTSGGTIEFRTDSLNGPLLATSTITGTQGWSNFQNFSIDVVNPNEYANGTVFLGVKTIYLVFKGGNGFLFDVDKFIFNPADVLVTDLSFTNCPSDTLNVGDILDLDVAITPINATNQTIAFTASDGTSVDFLSGEFTAGDPGTITVTATSFSDGAVFDQCLINVKEQVFIDPYQEVEGESYSAQSGTQLGGSGIAVGYIQNNDYIRFDNVDFGRGPFSGQVTASSNTGGGTVEFRTDSLNGPLLATSTITGTQGWSNFQNFPIDVVNPDEYANGTVFLGVKTIYLVFKGGNGFLFDVDKFIFSPVDILVTDLSFTNCPSDTLNVGDILDLDVAITPINATNQTIAFTASDGTSVDFLSGEFTAGDPGTITVTATSFSDGAVFDQCVIIIRDTVVSTPTQAVTDLILINSDTDQDIGSLLEGDTLNLFYLGSNLSVRAETDPESVGSIGFNYDGDVDFQTENVAPYAIQGDVNGDYKPWSPTIGNHSLVVTPYSGTNKTGDSGVSIGVNFTVISEDTTTVIVPPTGGDPIVSGELKKWHKVTISFPGPQTSETDLINPFMDYRLDVTFTNGIKTYVVPGYYAADGNAENTSATAGNIWKVHFSPDEIGTWNYVASFRTGTDIAVSSNSLAGTATSFDGVNGTIAISASDKTGRDFRNAGRLEYVGEHYLRFRESGEYFFKVGADAPENTFAYEDFDATPNQGGRRKSWSLHAGDFDLSDAGAYTWGDTISDNARAKGRELLGVINYLAGQGMNVFSFLTFSLDGDDDNVYPHLPQVANASSYNNVFVDRFDVSKLAQWEKILEYADKKGVYMHFKTQETENDQKMDGGQLGRERKIYYRELIARFGHHLALNWNLGEENDIWEELNDPDNAIVKSYAQYISDIDPYNHNIVIHTYPGQQDEVYNTLLGDSSELTGASVQTGINNVHRDVRKWVTESNLSGEKWVVANDEQGSATTGVSVDLSYPAGQLPETNSRDDNRDDVRNRVLWGTMLAGGAGVEYYYGYQTGCDDLDCQDHRTRASKWRDAKIALDFFNTYLQESVTGMVSNDGLTASATDYVFEKPGEMYVVYLPEGGSTTINLSGLTESYKVQWYDPRNGGALTNGTVSMITGGGSESIGTAPDNVSEDWVALITEDDTPAQPFSVLVYHETAGFRHGSISNGISMIEGFGTNNGWNVDQSQNSNVYTDVNLAKYDVVIWLNTSGNGLLTGAEQDAFERFIQNGGGYVGVHAATDTYRDGSWSWYNELAGAIVQTSPNHTSNNTNTIMDVVGSHPAVNHLGTTWNKSEEYYYWERNGGFLFSENINLLNVRSTGSNSFDAPRPVTWYKNYDGGKSFYTALGHNGSDYSSNSDFITMMEEAIIWAGSDQSTFGRSAAETGTNIPVDQTESISIYPNPVVDELSINIPEQDNNVKYSVTLMTLDGKVVKELRGMVESTKLNVSEINQGVYLLGIQGDGQMNYFRILIRK